MESSTGIVLEGGAMRSIFSAGVLDFLMDKGIEIPNMIAVSAGAYVGLNYISGQRGRCMDAMIEPLAEYKYMGMSTFFKKGTFFDMEYLFNEVPKVKSPFDFVTFKQFPGKFLTSTVDCKSGEAVYHEHFKDQDELFKILTAANSMPFIAKISQIGGRPMLDGGMADAIPIAKALEEGWNKIIVVLTRDITYRKKEKNRLYQLAIDIVYHRYPKFVKLIRGRGKYYNNSLDAIAQLEKEGRAFVLRPTTMTVGNKESDVETLKAYYRHGYDTAKERFGELLQFLGLDSTVE
ncbi:MAG: patatin family protein [Acetatifactor sp.]|nr:patatin family protein [Acetatifactor sp.]